LIGVYSGKDHAVAGPFSHGGEFDGMCARANVFQPYGKCKQKHNIAATRRRSLTFSAATKLITALVINKLPH